MIQQQFRRLALFSGLLYTISGHKWDTNAHYVHHSVPTTLTGTNTGYVSIIMVPSVIRCIEWDSVIHTVTSHVPNRMCIVSHECVG